PEQSTQCRRNVFGTGDNHTRKRLQNSRQRSDGIASPGEVVSCRVVKQFGADTVEVAARVRQALDDLRPTIFGPDLDRLARLAAEAREILEGAPDITDLRAEQLTGLPQICVTVDRPSAVGGAPARRGHRSRPGRPSRRGALPDLGRPAALRPRGAAAGG